MHCCLKSVPSVFAGDVFAATPCADANVLLVFVCFYCAAGRRVDSPYGADNGANGRKRSRQNKRGESNFYIFNFVCIFVCLSCLTKKLVTFWAIVGTYHRLLSNWVKVAKQSSHVCYQFEAGRERVLLENSYQSGQEHKLVESSLKSTQCATSRFIYKMR